MTPDSELSRLLRDPEAPDHRLHRYGYVRVRTAEVGDVGMGRGSGEGWGRGSGEGWGLGRGEGWGLGRGSGLGRGEGLGEGRGEGRGLGWGEGWNELKVEGSEDE